jgi:hypothetical protein
MKRGRYSTSRGELNEEGMKVGSAFIALIRRVLIPTNGPDISTSRPVASAHRWQFSIDSRVESFWFLLW